MSDRLTILKMMRLLGSAVIAGEQGLLLRKGEIVQRSLTEMEKAYDAALACSLKISLTTDDCTTLDQQSHEIEILRSKLRTLISDLRKQEALQG